MKSLISFLKNKIKICKNFLKEINENWIISSDSLFCRYYLQTWLFTVITVSVIFFSTPCETHAQEFSGRDRYEAAQLEAVAAFPSGSDTAILASGEGLGRCPLGHLPCWSARRPYALHAFELARVLTHRRHSHSSSPRRSYSSLSETALDDTVMHQVSQHPGVKSTVRLGGNNRIETQMEIYGYGKDRGLWTSDTVIVANARGFADALTASPFTYKNGCPLFLVNGSFFLRARTSASRAYAFPSSHHGERKRC